MKKHIVELKETGQAENGLLGPGMQESQQANSPRQLLAPTTDPLQTSREEASKRVENQKIAAGRRAWTLLHNYRGCDPQWVELWEHFIPSGGCSCKEGYKAILKDHPFDYSSPDAFFESGVVLHNAVNRKLEKPQITLEEARQIWNRTCDVTDTCNAGEKCCRERKQNAIGTEISGQTIPRGTL